MRNRYTHTAAPIKKFQFRRRFTHNKQIQEDLVSKHSNIQDSQSTDINTNIQDDYMDFQYDESDHFQYNNNNSSKESSENDNDNKLLEDEETNDEDDEEIDDECEEEIYNEDEEEIDDEYEEEIDDEYEEEIDNEYEEEIDDKDNDEEIDNKDNNNKYKNIIDEALNKDQMSSYNNDNEFAPYFENFTAASIFCWVQKHNISTNAYEDLVDIIYNPKFVSTHVIKNIRRFRKFRQQLPLLPILANSISISSKKTSSTSKNSKIAYQLSINDIIWHVLNNPSLMKHMYFGPGINSEIKSEYWHGTLWGESPFYGQEKIIISHG